jgi:hypothetical protein
MNTNHRKVTAVIAGLLAGAIITLPTGADAAHNKRPRPALQAVPCPAADDEPLCNLNQTYRPATTDAPDSAVFSSTESCGGGGGGGAISIGRVTANPR